MRRRPRAVHFNVDGNHNTTIGYGALRNNISGNFNIAIGELAGFDFTMGSANIYIGSDAGGATEADTIRIGRLLLVWAGVLSPAFVT